MTRIGQLALLAVALLAGTTGYVVHRYLARPAPLDRVAAGSAPAVEGSSVAAWAASSTADALGWSFADLDGEPVALDQWRGRLVVVNFWATWCPPCLREIPVFVDLQARHAGSGLQFVGVALDEPEAVASFVAEKAMNYPVLVGNDDVIRYMQSLGNAIGGLPYTAVIAPDGTVLDTHQGEWKAEDATAAIEGFLATRP